jgi:hypothetical protein
MDRQCSRPGCSTHAGATLTYDYSAGLVFVDRLADEAHPMSYDLCLRHADRLSVPNGWDKHDRRVSAISVLGSSSQLAS